MKPKNKTKLLLSAFVLTLVLAYPLFLFVLHDFDPYFWKIDACFDNGGCWDHRGKICRIEEPNAQELCNPSRGTRAEDNYDQLINSIKQ